MESRENDSIPVLEGEALEAVNYRGGHMQIIAAAGSGKTEVVSQRVASLLGDGIDPRSIVAFTFTEKAAEEMKERIRQRVSAMLGAEATDKLGQLFVGTIHSFCFHLLQDFVPLYETYTPLDSNQLASFLYREASHLGLKEFDGNDRVFPGIATFLRSIDVVENELLNLDSLPEDSFNQTARAYYDALKQYRFLSFGTQIVETVNQLRKPNVHERVTSQIKYLIVDEYQDVNPAQEELIRLLSKPLGNANLTVVGDDDQAIYQWRGSAVSNIVTFRDRYPDVKTFHLLENRRSRPGIVQLANEFAHTIPGRLDKQMDEHRAANGPAVAVAVDLPDEQTEATQISRIIQRLNGQGVPFRQMSILVRARTAYPKILDALAKAEIPVQPGGREGLFQKSEAAVFGKTYCWLAGVDWKAGAYAPRQVVGLDDILDDYSLAFGLTDTSALRTHLEAWQKASAKDTAAIDLVGDFYNLVTLLGVKDWDLSDERQRLRLGTLARVTQVLADQESVFRRSRRDESGDYYGGMHGGKWFYFRFATMLVNYANGNYDDFDGEDDPAADGVNLDTVHSAKGLEWPVVFLPSLTARRFPSSRTGQPPYGGWLLPQSAFDASRYEGTDADERRLFYVALTRARDWVSLSSHAKTSSRAAAPSPYILQTKKWAQGTGLVTGPELKQQDEPDLNVTYSDLAAYQQCPQSYFLRTELGFMPPVTQEIGYGNAVHHVLRVLANEVKATGKRPTHERVDGLVESDFFLPFANPASYQQMKEKARRLVHLYVDDHQSDLSRTWATERPFELYLPGLVVSGRADVIFDEQGGVPNNLAIVDYKTTTIGGIEPLQLQTYTDAARREGLTVGAAFVHDLDTTTRSAVDIDDASVKAAEETVITTAKSLKDRDFTPKPKTAKCIRCDVRLVCGAAKLKKPR